MMPISPDNPEPAGEVADLPRLDAGLASLLEAIEAEKVPARLLKLAEQLQGELTLRKQRQNPN
ncbi:hypothetical protein SAMN02745172_03062 [Pseudoxanthobacter soli DSM 19599]|uniref:Uncharacterized protein n=1 Tax=Pseudoxanthobacter soli DSM 19599 TaxID=1123029 RepID=A0A1M7ZND0_9HYPH|nr:hypothetical protein [Pseudoxanthobacter soli]SHO66403.1 hypothetical protein SAMN02745172_03062 [Pseudoxanthobacter soli DSM 19599]